MPQKTRPINRTRNFDAKTPQLKVIKEWFEAFSSLDATKRPRVPKNFKYEAFPKAAELPDEKAIKGLTEKFGGVTNSISSMEITVQEVIEVPGKVVTHVSAVCTVAGGATLNYESATIFTLVEEGGELKILHCMGFSDQQQRSATRDHTGRYYFDSSFTLLILSM